MKKMYKSPILNEPGGVDIPVRPSLEIHGEDSIYKFTGFEGHEDILEFLKSLGDIELGEIDSDGDLVITYKEYEDYYG